MHVCVKSCITDIIIWQVSPSELEALLLTHHAVADVAVIGVPDESAGELPRAYVVKKPGHGVTEAELIDFVASKDSNVPHFWLYDFSFWFLCWIFYFVLILLTFLILVCHS